MAGSSALKGFTSDFLQLNIEPRPHAQIMVYDRCIRELRESYNWIAFVDLDEFLAVRDK
jgi:hypothetical protein